MSSLRWNGRKYGRTPVRRIPRSAVVLGCAVFLLVCGISKIGFAQEERSIRAEPPSRELEAEFLNRYVFRGAGEVKL